MEPVAHYCRYYRVTPYKGISHHSLINNKPPLSWATLSVFETGFIISLFSSLKWQRTCSNQNAKRLAFEIRKDSHVLLISKLSVFYFGRLTLFI